MKKLLLAVWPFLLLHQPALWAQPADSELVPETETFQRKGIAFYQRQPDYPLTGILRNILARALPRFDYPLLRQDGEDDLLSFLKLVKAYQQLHAGEIAARRQTPDETIKFADKVVTWSETLEVMNALLAFSTDWRFSPITISQPIATLIREDSNGRFSGAPPAHVFTQILDRTEEVEDKETKKKVEKPVRFLIYYRVEEQSRLKCRLGFYDLAGSEPQLLRSWQNNWNLSESDAEHYITKADVAEASGRFGQRVEVSDEYNEYSKTYTATLVNGDKLPKLPRFQRMTQQKPEERFMPQAQYSVGRTGNWNWLITELKLMDSLALKGQITELGPERITLDFGGGETPMSLNLHLRDAYSLYETRLVDGVPQQVEIGFSRIRRFTERTALAEPLLFSRPPELGDSVRENLIGNGSLHLSPQLVFTPRGPYTQLYLGGEFFQHLLSASELKQAADKEGLSLEDYQSRLLPDWVDEQAWTAGLALGHSLQRPVFTGEVDLGYTLRQAHQQWLWSGSLVGSAFFYRSSTETADPKESMFGLGIGPKLGLSWQSSPGLTFGLNLGGRLALPFEASSLNLDLVLNAQW